MQRHPFLLLVNLNRVYPRIAEDKRKEIDMKWLTLNYIKQQLRIEPDFTLEDDMLTLYGNSAENTLLQLCNRSYESFLDEYGEIPQDIIHATLMLVDVSYHQRSPISQYQLYAVGYAFDQKVKPYMWLTKRDDDNVETTEVPIGSDTKIEFTADLPDDLTLADITFTGKVINANQKDKVMDFTKADCIKADESGEYYVVLVDTETMGVGSLVMKLTVQIPDTDYASGYRKEVVKINPHIRITG